MRIVVAGSSGNLGRKIVDHLVAAPWCDGIVAIDNRKDDKATAARITPVVANLSDPTETGWRETLAGADALVHFATRNPWPDGSWEDAADSVAMTARLLDAVVEAGVSGFVFASSNHVMGGYKDPPLSDKLAPGGLTADLPPSPGTAVTRDGVTRRPAAYGSSKLFGEALAAGKAGSSRGKLTAVSVRIGWCQPGENHPRTMNALARPLPPAEAEAANRANPRDIAWFRGMWLSNRDLAHVIERAIRADASRWPAPAIVVSGVSANTGTLWDIASARTLIGYEPADDWTNLLPQ